jgi:hypothetical protein
VILDAGWDLDKAVSAFKFLEAHPPLVGPQKNKGNSKNTLTCIFKK